MDLKEAFKPTKGKIIFSLAVVIVFHVILYLLGYFACIATLRQYIPCKQDYYYLQIIGCPNNCISLKDALISNLIILAEVVILFLIVYILYSLIALGISKIREN